MDVLLLNPYNHKQHQSARLSTLDIKATALQKAHQKRMDQGIKQMTVNMLKDNEPLDKISKFTALSQEVIRDLKNKL